MAREGGEGGGGEAASATAVSAALRAVDATAPGGGTADGDADGEADAAGPAAADGVTFRSGVLADADATDASCDDGGETEVYDAGNGDDNDKDPDDLPDVHAPVKGAGFNGLEDTDSASADSEDEMATEEEEYVCLREDKRAATSRGAFLLQASAGDDAVAAALPGAEFIDFVLGTFTLDPSSPKSKVLGDRVEEDVLIFQLLLQRLHTPGLLRWAGRDGVLLGDVALAAERIRHSLVCALRALRGGP